MNKMNEIIIKKALNNYSFKLELTDDPLPATKGIKAFKNIADSFSGGFTFNLGMAFIPASLIVFFIRERATESKL